MSKCREAYKTHMQNPQHRCHFHEWQAAWNAATENAAKICDFKASDCVEAIRKEKTE